MNPFPMNPPHVIILMGVAGSGKSTVAALLASQNGGKYYDADEFHPAANIAKMAAGIPLEDEDRWPWLHHLRAEVIDATPEGELSVLACSALKKSYRALLGVGQPGIALVYLHGTAELLAERLEHRTGHYMKAALLESQLATLEEPLSGEAIVMDISQPVTEIVASIERALGFQK
jgi:gluconokinase